MSKIILGIFARRENADVAVNQLKGADFTSSDMSIMVKDRVEVKGTTTHIGTKVAEGTATGAAAGAIIGGAAGLLAGMGAIAVPGIGAFLVSGPVATVLGITGATAATATGAATGALAGGIIGALTGLGVPKEKAEIYERKLKEGAILLAVGADENREKEAIHLLENNGATDVVEVGGGISSFNELKEDRRETEDHRSMSIGY